MEEYQRWNKDITRHPLYFKPSDYGQHFKIVKTWGKSIPKDFKPNTPTLLRHIFYRRSLGMNTFVLILGNVRSGKSWTGLKINEEYSKESKKQFDVDKQVSFRIPKFLRWSAYNMDSCFMCDEIQLSMGSREWWSTQHRVFNQFCDIQGFRRNLAVFTMPSISFIDKHLRFLINYIVVSLNQGFVKWFKVQIRHELGKGWLQKIGTMKIGKPSKDTTVKYEAMKKAFNDEHLTTSIELLDNLTKPNERQQLKDEYYRLRNEKIRMQLSKQKEIIDDPFIPK